MQSTFRDRVRPGLLRSFAVAGLVAGAAVVLVLALLLAAEARLESANHSSLKSAHVLADAATAERFSIVAATSTRAYLLTGRAQFAREARSSYFAARRAIAQLSRAVADNPAERRKVDAIARDTTRLGQTWLLPSLARGVRSPSPYRAFAAGERARVELRRRYVDVVSEEEALQSTRIARVRRLDHRARLAGVGAMVAIPALLLLFLVYVGLVFLRPVRKLAELATRVERGDEGATGKPAGAREIAALQAAFNRMSSSVGERRRAILEHAPITIWEAVGRDLRWISPHWRTLVGDGVAEPTSVHDIDVLIHPDDRALIAEQRRQGMASGAPFEYRYRLLRPDGGIRWIWTRAARIGVEDGKPRTIGFSLDVTDDERTRQELFHAQRLESIGALAGGVAHDFNNLLTVISGYAELAQQRTHQPGRLETPLAEIRAAAARASELTRQLLTFGRRQPFEPQLLDLNDVVTAVLPMLERLIEEQIRVECSLGAGLPGVRFDRSQLEQVIVNLAVNSRDAIKGPGRIAIATAGGSDGRVSLSVADDGVGMDAETLDRIFDPFFTTKPPGEGTGLGLSTVHGIVARGGGRIEVESTPGRGTTFTIRFPTAEELHEAA